ncbi:MAG: heavy metal translocating P-type ATPase [Clostridia bacterium]|nr:heavy metal translocating P-type ATPase [Clostridia bacterium]
MKKEKFDIKGMTCSSCSAHVEKAVKKLEGIQKVNVNLLSNNMTVEYNEKVLNDEKIINAVTNEGYGASLCATEKEETRKVQEIEEGKDEIKSMKKRLIISVCFLIPLMYIAMYHMISDWLKIPIPHIVQTIFHGSENAITFGFTQLLLLLPIVYVNRNYFIVGFKRLFKGSPNMDSLIAIGSAAAIVYGIVAIYMIGYGLGHNQIEIVKKYTMDIYFESAGTILTLITVGKYLEAKSKGKTSDAIKKLINLAPKTAIVIREENEIEVNFEEIVIGDIIVIKPGGGIPVDGVIIEGSSTIDQSSITGESVPVEKKVGDSVVSGTINKNGYFKMKATKVGNDTTLSQIIKLVEEASNSKAPISKLADKVSGIFVPCVITIAILATAFWLLQGQTIEFALSIGIAVLVISCPCALGLATPVAIMVGTGKGAQNGILIKSAESLEILHSVDTIVLDKTGTITEGKPKVTNIITDINEKELLKIAGSLEKNSEHPLAEAIIEKAKEENIDLIKVSEFEAVLGRGIIGKIDGRKYYGGNLKLMEEYNINVNHAKKQAEEFSKQGKTVLYFANEESIIGTIAVADTLKLTSKQAIKELKRKNKQIVMLTGDNKIVAGTIGKEIGITEIVSEVLPQDKEKEVYKLQKEGKKVAFVGDGINDSPALVRADVGLAIGSGTDIAIESADIVLMKNDLFDVVTAINLSKAVIKNIKMNLFWAFFYNAIGIPVAAGVFYLGLGLKLNPMIGVAAMSLSSVCVVTNALRLKRFKPTKYEVMNLQDIQTSIETSKNLKEENKMNKKIIIIEGMQCNHCKMSVEKALSSIEGIITVEVSLENKTAIVEATREIENSRINEVIEEAGFTVKEIK